MDDDNNYTYSSSSRIANYEPPAFAPPEEVPALTAPRSRSVRLANGVTMYYKEAGDPYNPTILLLHGFPTSSNYFRNLVPLLAAHTYGFHVIAPDLPGFGATECPEGFEYTFQKLAETIVLLLAAIDVGNFVVYCMGEYGTLVALKAIQFKLENIIGLVIQNGTVYNEGRLDSSLLDVYRTGVVPPVLEEVPSVLAFAEKGASDSGFASYSVSRRNSNISLLSDTSQRPAGGSRVSFGRFDQYMHGEFNTVSYASSAAGEYDGSDDGNVSAATGPEVPNLALTLNDASFSTVCDNYSDDTNSVLDPAEITVGQIKSLYMPSTSGGNFTPQGPVYGLNRSKPCAVDPHAYLMDYFFLTRPTQPRIQSQLYRDFMNYRRPIPLSSPVNMWLRTTNTPILVLWGTNDPLLSQETTLDNFKRDCRNCSVKTFDNGGHFALEYYPEDIALAISEFFRKFKDTAWDLAAY